MCTMWISLIQNEKEKKKEQEGNNWKQIGEEKDLSRLKCFSTMTLEIRDLYWTYVSNLYVYL